MDAPDAAVAEAIMMEAQPGAKVHGADGATVTEENRVQCLGRGCASRGNCSYVRMSKPYL